VKRLRLIPPLAGAAIAAGGGSKPPAGQGQGQGQGAGWQTCTDQQHRVVDDNQCNPQASGDRPGRFRWYYYPYGGRPYPFGWSVPLGGSYSDAPHAGVARAGVVRGGFGATGGGHNAGS
jgi:hypothetical protein